MTVLVIDASRNSIRQLFLDRGVVGTLHYMLQFHIFRPILVISIRGLLELYMGYSISSVSPDGLPFEQLRIYGNIIADMGGVLVVWMILSRLNRAVRRRTAHTPTVPTASAGVIVRTSRGALHGQQQLVQQHPRNTHLPVVDHDDNGGITHVRPWQKWVDRPAPAGIATSPTPFTRSPEYDPDEPVLGSRPVDEATVLEALDRIEPSLAGSDAPAQPPRNVAKVVDATTTGTVGSHHFGHRGRLDHSDQVEPTLHELAAQMYAMRPGMARYYGSVIAVMHGRAAVQTAGRATEHHRTRHTFGMHVQVEDPCAQLRRTEHIDLLHGFGHRSSVMANDA